MIEHRALVADTVHKVVHALLVAVLCLGVWESEVVVEVVVKNEWVLMAEPAAGM